MDTSDHDARIQSAVDQENVIRDQMEKTAQNYKTACVKYLQNHFAKSVEREVVTNPEITSNLGIKKLGELKAELKQVMEKVPEEVERHLGSDELWDHRQSLPEGDNPWSFQTRAGSKVREEIRELLSPLGQILVEYGFDPDSWQQRSNAKPRYRYGMTHSDEMNQLMIQYGEQAKLLMEAHQVTSKLRKEKDQAIARDLWNQV